MEELTTTLVYYRWTINRDGFRMSSRKVILETLESFLNVISSSIVDC